MEGALLASFDVGQVGGQPAGIIIADMHCDSCNGTFDVRESFGGLSGFVAILGNTAAMRT